MPVRTYDPKQVVLTVGGFPVSGFADGTFIKVMRDNDTFTKISGADGEVSRAKSNDRGGNIEITLAQTSLSNDVLTGIALADELSNDGVVPVLVKDIGGTSTFVSAFGWIRKPPDSEYSKEVGERLWIMDLADLDIFTGGNAAAE